MNVYVCTRTFAPFSHCTTRSFLNVKMLGKLLPLTKLLTLRSTVIITEREREGGRELRSTAVEEQRERGRVLRTEVEREGGENIGREGGREVRREERERGGKKKGRDRGRS